MRVEIELTDKLKEYVDDYIDIGGGDNVFCYPDNIIKAIREGIERQTSEWEEERDERHGISRFTCSQCGNVIQDVEDRITFFTFNRYCGRCGSKNA